MGVIEWFGEASFFNPLTVSQAQTPQLGQLVWTPVLQLQAHPSVLEGKRVEDTQHKSAWADWKPLNDTHFTRRDHKDLPILNLSLGETEELIVHKAKRRPGIIVGTNGTLLGGLGRVPPHHEENRLVVAPLYDIASASDPKGFSALMAKRVRFLLYRQYFPLARWQETRSKIACPDGCSIREGVVRFDRLHFVQPTRPSCRLVPLKVATDPFALMHSMLWAYLHGPMSAEIAELREMIASMAPTEPTPQR